LAAAGSNWKIRGMSNRHLTIAAAFAGCVATTALAQTAAPPFALRPTSTKLIETKDAEYGRADTVVLRMDVYRPAERRRTPTATLIFFNRASGADRRQPFWESWARAAASRGLVAILPDLRDGTQAADFQKLVGYLTTRGAEIGVDRDAIAVYAASGNVFTAFPIVEDPTQTAIKAAVMYYGSAPISEFRRDLPLLYVRAGLDRPSVNAAITTLAALAVSQNAPVTLLNHASGYHAFEMFNDDDATRDVMEQTIAFVKRVTAPSFQAAMRGGIPEATAAAYVQTREFAKAVPIYRELVAARPEDARLRLSYGEALLGSSDFAEACAQFERLKGKGLGPRDLGLPAARACMQKGDAAAAIAWLKSIPSRFLPVELRDDAVFAPIRDREDFRALFVPR
jgi:dienelactone hydrolase